MDSNLKILSVGAGPKAIALATLLHVLREQGYSTPELIVLDRAGIAANWLGQSGFTNGDYPVDTSPAKDIGFPYESGFDAAVDDRLAAFSFFNYQRKTKGLSNWVNRGMPNQTHREFAQYLRWVARQIGLSVKKCTVQQLVPSNGAWTVSVQHPDGSEGSLSADAVLISGPGTPVMPKIDGKTNGQISNGQSVWTQLEAIGLRRPNRVAVVGTGQSGATAALAVRNASPSTVVEIVSTTGILPLQSAGFTENRLCTDPDDTWRYLTDDEKDRLLSRINNGVVEASLKARLDEDRLVHVRQGRVMRARVEETGVTLSLSNGCELGPYGHVVMASGFDAAESFRRLLPHSERGRRWAKELGRSGTTDARLGVVGAPAPLYAPSLAAMDWGPGAMLLSCLGKVASAIVTGLVTDTRISQPGCCAIGGQDSAQRRAIKASK